MKVDRPVSPEGFSNQGVKSLSSRRILLVGDPALSRSLISSVLNRLGYVVSVVVSAREALEKIAHSRYALLMISSSLPDMTGVALVREIVARARPGKPTGVLVFGDAVTHQAHSRELQELGIDGFLQKPISISRLVATVRAVTERNPQTAAAMSDVLSTTVPLDLDHLAAFTEGDRQLERELSSLFVATAGKYLESLRQCRSDPVEWRSHAHALKGASGNFGAHALADIAAQAEHEGPSAAILERLDAAFAEVSAFIERRQR